ncbi:YqaJ viral recombinase family protein [Gulosibacter macacae]|nr:YqaJ viral recombinase family protein [Gulosibacter macacae]
MSKQYEKGVVVVDADAPRLVWLDARAEGVTASEIHEIASGDLKVWERILEQKLNGSRFQGNAHTRRGNEREALLLDFAATIDPTIEPNGALWAAALDGRFRGTPDGIGDGTVAEVKSHAHGHKLAGVPPEHRAQMQWQMLVTGATRALYVREVMDEDGLGALDDPDWQWIHRDDEYIAYLVGRAVAFLDWWDDDMTVVASISGDDEELLKVWLAEKAKLTPVEKSEAAAKRKLTAAMKARQGSKFGVQFLTDGGGAVLTGASWSRSLDESRVPKSLLDARTELRARADRANTALKNLEDDLLREYGVDSPSGSQSLRLIGGAK